MGAPCEHGDWSLQYLNKSARRMNKPIYVCGLCGKRFKPAQWRAVLREKDESRSHTYRKDDLSEHADGTRFEGCAEMTPRTVTSCYDCPCIELDRDGTSMGYVSCTLVPDRAPVAHVGEPDPPEWCPLRDGPLLVQLDANHYFAATSATTSPSATPPAPAATTSHGDTGAES